MKKRDNGTPKSGGAGFSSGLGGEGKSVKEPATAGTPKSHPVNSFSEPITILATSTQVDPNELHEKLLKDNNLSLDFDVLEGTVTTKYGIIKLDKPTLVVKASYVERK